MTFWRRWIGAENRAVEMIGIVSVTGRSDGYLLKLEWVHYDGQRGSQRSEYWYAETDNGGTRHFEDVYEKAWKHMKGSK